MSSKSSGRSGAVTAVVVVVVLIAAYFLLGPVLSLAWGVIQAVLWVAAIAGLTQTALILTGRKGFVRALRTRGASPAAIPEAFTRA
jgi:hypothetical protein